MRFIKELWLICLVVRKTHGLSYHREANRLVPGRQVYSEPARLHHWQGSSSDHLLDSRSILVRRGIKDLNSKEEKIKNERKNQSKVTSPVLQNDRPQVSPKNKPTTPSSSRSSTTLPSTKGRQAGTLPLRQSNTKQKSIALDASRRNLSTKSNLRPLQSKSRVTSTTPQKSLHQSSKQQHYGKHPMKSPANAQTSKGQRLCRRGNEIEVCGREPERSKGQSRKPDQPSSSTSPPGTPRRAGSLSRGKSGFERSLSSNSLARSRSSSPQPSRSSSPQRDRSNNPHGDPLVSMIAPAQQTMMNRKAEKSLEINKRRYLSKANTLNTAILGTNLASGITSTSATFAGACCPTGMACGSHVIPCAAAATTSLGAAGICIGCIGAGLIGYKVYDDHKANKALQEKIDSAYSTSHDAKGGLEQMTRTFSDANKRNQDEFNKAKGRLSHEARERERLGGDLGQTKQQISEVEKKALDRAQSVETKALNRAGSVEKKADTALNRADSVEKKTNNQVNTLKKGVADARNQATEAKIGQMQTEKNVNDVKNLALTAQKKTAETSASVSSLQRSHSDRLAQMEAEMNSMRAMMAQYPKSGYAPVPSKDS